MSISFQGERKPLLIDVQNEYAQIMHKRVAEQKAKQAEIRKRRASSMRK